MGDDISETLIKSIHISSDSSADQIDQIFASMAKDIYRRDIKNE
jgi:hypothetical protein